MRAADQTPRMTRTRGGPVLLLLAAAGGAVALGAAVVDWGVGVVVGFGVLIAGVLGMAWLDFQRERSALLARLAGREAVPVERQARDLLSSRGLAVHEPALSTIIARWKEVGAMLAVDPAILRPGDDLREDYRPTRPAITTPSVLERMEWEVNKQKGPNRVPARMHEATGDRCPNCRYDLAGVPAGAPCPECGGKLVVSRCIHCKYDLGGLPAGAPCPECGTEQVVIRTLGDYLLFVARLIPARGPDGGG